MVDWARLGADIEAATTQAALRVKRLTRTVGPMVVQPYHGFVAGGTANVRARVLEKPLFEPPLEALSLDATLRSNLLRWVVLDMPGVEVTVSVAGTCVTAVSDADGFVVSRVPVGDLAAGWHPVTFEADDRGRAVTATGRVVKPDPTARIAVISDIDDTVLLTGITDGFASAGRTLLHDAYRRKPVAGAPALYRGLARGTGDRPESTFFYVSSSPWNLYEMLVQFLVLQGFPEGPLFLRDWRPVLEQAGSEPGPGHKRARIRRLLDVYPQLRFVLVGDSGEQDQEIFAEFLASDPDRIAAALVRDVRAGPRRSVDVPDRAIPTGVAGPLAPTVGDPLALALEARGLGLVDHQTVEEVATELSKAR